MLIFNNFTHFNSIFTIKNFTFLTLNLEVKEKNQYQSMQFPSLSKFLSLSNIIGINGKKIEVVT